MQANSNVNIWSLFFVENLYLKHVYKLFDIGVSHLN